MTENEFELTRAFSIEVWEQEGGACDREYGVQSVPRAEQNVPSAPVFDPRISLNLSYGWHLDCNSPAHYDEQI